MAHEFGEAQPSGIQPREITPAPAQAARLPHKRSPQFFYKFHPRRWHMVEIEGEQCWVPLLGTLRIVPGLNGVDRRGEIQDAKNNAERDGWVLLPWSLTPDTKNYIVAWPAQGGDYHCSRWETPRQVGGRTLKSKVDSDGYNKWCKWLVDEGHVPQPDPEVLGLVQIDQQEKIVQNKIMREGANPEAKEGIEAAKKRLEDMKEATADVAKKKRAPRRRKKQTSKDDA